MGFFKKIGKAFKSIGKGLGKVAKGVVKFAKSPIGKLLITAGLTLVTGGTGGLLAKGLGMLGKLGSVGKAVSTFTGFASKFMGPIQSFVSKTGLSSVAGFLKQAQGSGDLLSMAKDIFASRQKQPPTDEATNQIIKANLMQLWAHQQSQQLNLAA